MKKKNYLCVAFMVAMLMVPVYGFARKGKVLKIDFKNPIVERMAGGSTFDLNETS